MNIRKYLKASDLIKTLENSELYFGKIENYEDSDPNEGRVTDYFLRNHQQLTNSSLLQDFFDTLEEEGETDIISRFNDWQGFKDEQLVIEAVKSLVARDYSFIQCWTKTMNCDAKLWEVFGDDHKGASFCSSISSISEVLNSYAYIEDEVIPFSGESFL